MMFDGPNAVEKQGQVSEQLSYLSGNLGNLEKSIFQLEEKLAPILSGNDVRVEVNENKKSTPLVELANQIAKMSGGIATLSDKLDSIRRRVEL